MDCQASEVTLQTRRWCGTATPNGPLSIAKGVLAIASPSLLSRRELVARRAVGLTLWLWPWISRRGGRDATRQTEATNPCATGAAQGAWRSRSSASLAPRWVAPLYPLLRPLPAAMVLVRRLVATLAERVQQVWDVAWVGVDAGLFAALTATGWAAWRHTWGRGGHDRHRDAALVGCVVRPCDRVGRGDHGGSAGAASAGALSLYFRQRMPQRSLPGV
jgi:hypothetical protein